MAQQILLILKVASLLSVAMAVCTVLIKQLLHHRCMLHSREAKDDVPAMIAENVVGTVLFLVISSMSNATLLQSEFWVRPETFFEGSMAAEIAGVFFIAYLVADSITVPLLGGTLNFQMIVHHILFIAIGMIIRAHCWAHLFACLLLAQETSTIPLDIYLHYRNRLPVGHWLPVTSYTVFFVLFVFYRLILNTIAAGHFLLNYRALTPARVPMWQAHVLAVALALGVAVQFMFAVPSTKTLMKLYGCRTRAQTVARNEAAPVKHE